MRAALRAAGADKHRTCTDPLPQRRFANALQQVHERTITAHCDDEREVAFTPRAARGSFKDEREHEVKLECKRFIAESFIENEQRRRSPSEAVVRVAESEAQRFHCWAEGSPFPALPPHKRWSSMLTLIFLLLLFFKLRRRAS